jgi:leucyl-tRNA synthetase
MPEAAPRRMTRESMSETPHRYTPELALEIEIAWQDRWEEEGTYHAPNPTGSLADPEAVAALSGGPLFVLDMFPYPSRRRPARRPPAGLHRHRRVRPLPADDRPQRRAHDGLSTRSACRPSSTRCRPAAPGNHHRGQHRQHARQLRRLGWLRPIVARSATTDPEFYRWTQWIFLQIFNSWYDTDAEDRGPPDRRAGRELDAGRTRPLPQARTGKAWAELTRRRAATSSTGTASRTCPRRP